MKKYFLIFIAFPGLLSCTDPADKDPELLFKRKIDQMKMESFKIPDSINTSLIIATYYNSEYDTQTLFIYDNADKKSVKKIDYSADSIATIDQLEILKRNEFRSTRYNVDYVVKQNTISIIHLIKYDSSPPALSKEFRRTDRD